MKEIKLHGNSIIIGKNSLDYIKELQIKRAFIITGGSAMFKNGAIDRITNILKDINAEYEIFSGVKKNPSINTVMDAIEKMKQFQPDTVMGIGGGSPIDVAKAAALFYEYPELDIKNPDSLILPKRRKKIKLIAIPSTSGTGTEVTRASVLTYEEMNLKIGLKCDAFIPDVAILDADLTLSMPKSIVAETGMDALTHAVECYINKNIDEFTEVLAEGAIKGLIKYLPLSYEHGDYEFREKVHIYSTMAGSAFSNVGLGMAHGISHALGGRFDLSHGLLNAIALPYVLLFNSRDEGVKERLNNISNVIGSDIIEEIIELNKKIGIPLSLKDAGLREEEFLKDFKLLVENSMKGSTRVNPVKVTIDDMIIILKAIYYGRLEDLKIQS
ncbi:MAG: iron-containing alcohol dehydrogenase [Caloramator sp.]|nr:iron-containing alcohol dehydrogenase [Caloramator sp.]